MNKIFLLGIFVVFGAGCTLISEKVNLKPIVMMSDDNIGKGRKVALIVEDRRLNKEIGVRNPMIHTGSITLNGDITRVFRDQMKQILESKGFVVVDDKSSAMTCKLTIREFKYDLVMGLVDVMIERRVVVDADVIKNSNENYFKNYFVDERAHEFMAPAQEENEELINQTLGNLFDKMVMDSGLYQALGK